MHLRVFPIAGDPGRFFTVHDHPLYEKKVYRFFHSMDAALNYKREVDSLFLERPITEMKLWQLADLFKEDRPRSLLLRYRINYFLEFLETFGAFYPKELSEAAVNTWTQQYAKERGHRQATIGGDRVFLNYFFRFLVEKNLLEKTPITGMVVGPKNCPLSKSDVRLILLETKRLSPGHIYPMVLLAVEIGASAKEIYALTWKSLDFRKGTVAFERNGYREVHKMSDELFFAIRKISKESLFVFISQSGRAMDGTTFFQTRARFQKISRYKERWTLDAVKDARSTKISKNQRMPLGIFGE